MEDCANEDFAEVMGNIVASFDHAERILRVNFTKHDEEIIKRDQAEREKKRAKTTKDDDVEMEDVDLPEETAQLGGGSPTPPAPKQSQSKSSSSKEEYEKAVESMKRSFGNATIVTRFNEPVDLSTIADEHEGGAFKLINRRVDMSGPPGKRALEATLTRSQSAGTKLPKVTDDPLQVHKICIPTDLARLR